MFFKVLMGKCGGFVCLVVSVLNVCLLLGLLLALLCGRWAWASVLCWCTSQLLWLPLTSRAPWLCSALPFGSWMNSEESRNNSQRISFLGLKLCFWEIIREHKKLSFSERRTLAYQMVSKLVELFKFFACFWDNHWIKQVIKCGYA